MIRHRTTKIQFTRLLFVVQKAPLDGLLFFFFDHYSKLNGAFDTPLVEVLYHWSVGKAKLLRHVEGDNLLLDAIDDQSENDQFFKELLLAVFEMATQRKF